MHSEQLCWKTAGLDFVKAVASALVITGSISIKHFKTFLSHRQIEILQHRRPTKKIDSATFWFIHQSCATMARIALCSWEEEQSRAHAGKRVKPMKPWWGGSLLSAPFAKQHRWETHLGSDVGSGIQAIQQSDGRAGPNAGRDQERDWNPPTLVSLRPLA